MESENYENTEEVGLRTTDGLLGHILPTCCIRDRHLAGKNAQHDSDPLLGRNNRGYIHSSRTHFQGARSTTNIPATKSDGRHDDDVMVQAFNSLVKAEFIRNPSMRRAGGWKPIRDIEIAVAEYLDWLNHRRLHGGIGLIPVVEFETKHSACQAIDRNPEKLALIGPGSK